MSDVVDLRPWLRSGDWAGLKSATAGLSTHAAHEAIRELADHGGVRAPLDGLVDGPDDLQGLTLTGGLLRYRAGRVRGGALAEQTPDQTMRAYQEILGQAFDHLEQALDLAPRDPLAAGFRSSLSVEEEEDGKRAAVKRVQEADGEVAAGALGDLLSAWTYKWGMSQPQMWDTFARLHDPRRLETIALVPQAHWEQQTHYLWFEQQGGKARGYYRSSEVRNALAAASDQALAAPEGTDAALLRQIDGWMARVFVDARNASRAREHLRRLGWHASTPVWANGIGLLTPMSRLKWYRRRSGMWFG